MKKLQINYNRVFPDHRVPFDHHFNKQLMQGPSTYFKLMKDGFNAGLTKNFHIYLSLAALAAFAVATVGYYWDNDPSSTFITRKTFPAYKYIIYTQKGGYGAYDNILHRFEKEPGGLRDLPYNQ